MILYLAVGTWTTQYLRMSVSSSVKNWINAGLLNLSGFLGGSVVKKKNPPANAGDVGSIPESGRTPGGHGKPLHYYCLGNPMDRGVW